MTLSPVHSDRFLHNNVGLASLAVLAYTVLNCKELLFTHHMHCLLYFLLLIFFFVSWLCSPLRPTVHGTWGTTYPLRESRKKFINSSLCRGKFLWIETPDTFNSINPPSQKISSKILRHPCHEHPHADHRERNRGARHLLGAGGAGRGRHGANGQTEDNHVLPDPQHAGADVGRRSCGNGLRWVAGDVRCFGGGDCGEEEPELRTRRKTRRFEEEVVFRVEDVFFRVVWKFLCENFSPLGFLWNDGILNVEENLLLECSVRNSFEFEFFWNFLL